MKRKIALLLGSFILLLFAFGVYQLFVPGIAIFDPTTRIHRPDLGKLTPGGDPRFGGASEVRLVARNAAGQLRGIYKVASWNKEDDDSFSLVKPSAVVYLKDGTRTYINADKGRLWASEVPGGIDVRQGFFEGNVRIYFDQSTEMYREHPEQRSHDEVLAQCISIFTNDLRFSRDMLEVRTDSRVVVWSKMLDIVGKGLVLRWNEDPRELRLLKINHGEIMAVKDLPEDMDLMQMTKPTEEKKSVALVSKAPAKAKTPKAKPKPKIKKLTKQPKPKTAPAKAPAKALAKVDAPPDKGGVDVMLTDKPMAPADLPPAPPTKARPTVRNKYQATFSKDVRVHSGTQSVAGTELLDIFFEWDRAWRAGSKKKKKAPAKVASKPPAKLKPATKPASKVTVASKAEEIKKSVAKKSTASQPTTAATKPSKTVASAKAKTAPPTTDEKRRLEIYWQGPLEIRPVGTVPMPDPKRFKILGKGKRIILGDTASNMTCICSEFELQNPRTTAFFRADKKNKKLVYLTVSGEELITTDDYIRCEVKDVDGGRNVKTLLVGQGQTRTFDEDGKSFALNPEQIDEPEQNARSYDKRVTWDESAEVVLDLLEVQADGDESRKRPRLRKVIAKGNVEVLIMPEDKALGEVTNYLKCGQADVDFNTTPAGVTYWKTAKVSGNFTGLMNGNAIVAKEATVFFRPPAKGATLAKKSDDKKSKAGEDSKAGEKILSGDLKFDSSDVSRILANGDVRIWYKNPDDPQAKESGLEAQTLDTLMEPGPAGKQYFRGVVTGKPAKVWQGKDAIEGEVIKFNNATEQLQVAGSGKLKFTTGRDVNGNELPTPRPVDIAWSRSLLVDGRDGYAVVDGDVDILSENDSMQCNQARLFFEKQPSQASGKTATKTPAKPTKGGQWSSLGAGMPSMGKITQIEAHGGKGDEVMVLMRSKTMNPQNPAWLQRRIEMRGDVLIFRPPSRQAEGKGAGTLLVEDYRHPVAQAKASDDGTPAGKLERPSQSAFKWQDRMLMKQGDRRVTLWGDVQMMHRSGNKVLKLAQEETEPWGKLTAGRLVYLGCQKMDAFFAEPTEKPSGQADPDQASTGPQLGALKTFKAVKDVTFKYDNNLIDGQSIEYFGPSKTLIVEGFLPGEKKHTPAHFEFSDPSTGLPRSLDCPRIIVRNFGEPNETFKLDRMEGKGSR